MKRSVWSFPWTSAGTLSTDEIKAAWKETNLWFAITQPRSNFVAFRSSLVALRSLHGSRVTSDGPHFIFRIVSAILPILNFSLSVPLRFHFSSLTFVDCSSMNK
jgi:hypothetical protein